MACETFFRGILQPPILLWVVATFAGRLATAKRVAVNQFVVSPLVYFPLFWLCTGVIQGLSLGETVSRARAGLPRCAWASHSPRASRPAIVLACLSSPRAVHAAGGLPEALLALAAILAAGAVRAVLAGATAVQGGLPLRRRPPLDHAPLRGRRLGPAVASAAPPCGRLGPSRGESERLLSVCTLLAFVNRVPRPFMQSSHSHNKNTHAPHCTWSAGIGILLAVSNTVTGCDRETVS